VTVLAEYRRPAFDIASLRPAVAVGWRQISILDRRKGNVCNR
jgi:hypothetical protein